MDADSFSSVKIYKHNIFIAILFFTTPIIDRINLYILRPYYSLIATELMEKIIIMSKSLFIGSRD